MQVLGWTDSQYPWASQVEYERWEDYLHAVNDSRLWLWASLDAAVQLLELTLCMQVLLSDPSSLYAEFWQDILKRFREGTLKGMGGEQYGASPSVFSVPSKRPRNEGHISQHHLPCRPVVCNRQG